jgi:DNA-binding transcriptional MerR regulator
MPFRIHLSSFNGQYDILRSMRVGFTPRQVMRLTGVPYSTLNLWAKNGLITPSISDGTGSGHERVYNFSDLVAIKVAFELRKAGVTTRSLQKVVNFVRKNDSLDKPLAEARLVVSGSDVLEVTSEQQLISVLSKPGQGCLSFIVDLPRTLGELAEIAEDTNAFAICLLNLPNRKPVVSASPTRHQRRKAK